MKKIITLLFFAGILTTSFAQSGHGRRNDNRDNGYQSSPNNANHNYGNDNRDGGYQRKGNDQWNNRNDGNEYGRNRNERDDHDGYQQRGYQRDHRDYSDDRGHRDYSHERRQRHFFFFRNYHEHDRY